MALSKNQKALCRKLNSEFDSAIGPVKLAKGAVIAAKNELKNQLNAYSAGAVTPGLDGALDGFKDDVADNIPGSELEDLQEIKDFIDNCPYLSSLSPVSAVLSSIIGIFDEIENLIDGLTDSFPEFGMGKLGSLIDKLLDGVHLPGGDKLSELLKNLDKILDCLESICGYSVASRRLEVESLYDEMGLDSEANFDYTVLYNEVGLSASQVSAINKVKNGINDQKDLSSAAVDSTVSAFKSAIKKGLF